MALVPQYLRADEEARIHRQFQGDTWRRNNQVLWSGILRDEAQRWADEHEMSALIILEQRSWTQSTQTRLRSLATTST
jgi:hypothetical protein